MPQWFEHCRGAAHPRRSGNDSQKFYREKQKIFILNEKKSERKIPLAFSKRPFNKKTANNLQEREETEEKR
ncbi:MAG: hypothetical protein NC209_08355 [Alistipes sp.]|nr:hypothetical protein [Alistipes senegalensis]MCM1251134.1 hypothetical protein [Alistipes sp.]